MTVFRILHKPSGKFVGSGLSRRRPVKTWVTLGAARGAISAALGDKKSFRVNYEIIEFQLTEIARHAQSAEG